jgi:acyl-coenzyme A synthetase/AMP-(fatty) acid ligase
MLGELAVELTIGDALARAASAFGDNTAIAEPGGPRLTYAELHERALDVACALIAMDVQPGDRVAIWSPNTAEWVLAALGALTVGATLVPVNTRFTGHEALDVIGRSGARVLFVADWFLGTDLPRTELEQTTFELAGKIAAMPQFGLALSKRAVNQCEDQMGMRSGMDSVFGLHHVAHAHNAETGTDPLAGMDARSMKKAADGLPG